MDMVMKAEIEKILEEFKTAPISINDGNKIVYPIDLASSSLTALIIKWLEGKKVKVEERYSGLSNGYFTELDTKNIGRNQLITELIGEVR